MPKKWSFSLIIYYLFTLTSVTILGLWICDLYIAEQTRELLNKVIINLNVDKPQKDPNKMQIKIKNKILKDGSLVNWFETLNNLVEKAQKINEKLNVKKLETPKSETAGKDFIINPERGFWSGKGSVNKHLFDVALAQGLYKFFKLERAIEIIDLGGGMGLYTKYFCSRDLQSRCYDGNPDSQDISNGTCAVLDFTKEIHFLPFDWVLSLEVGEHLPAKYESMYLNNINRLNKKGVVLSWAVIGQGGSGHVNNRNNSYIIEKMKGMKYTYDKVSSDQLRKAAFWAWFKDTMMVFRK